MSSKARQTVRQPIVSLLAAVGASVLCLGIAVSPARAADRAEGHWARTVSNSLEQQVRLMDGVPPAVRASRAAIVGAHFDADGELVATSLDRATGIKLLDDEALRAVNHTAFPRLPASMRGKPRMVPVEVYFSTPNANRDRVAVRRQALGLAAGARRFYAEVPAGQPKS